MEEGIRIFKKLKEYGFPLLTDIHQPEQAKPVAEIVDVLQIPLFYADKLTCCAAAQTGRTVNIKKGQFLSPSEMSHVVQKLEALQAKNWQTERGSSLAIKIWSWICEVLPS